MKIEGLYSPTALKGKVSIMTGASRGLGKVMALALAEAGSDMVLVARNEEGIKETEKQCRNMGRKALAIVADVTKADDISLMVEKTISEFGKIDTLVNNAGLNASHVVHRFEDIPEHEWNSLMQTNLTSVFLISKIVGRVMLNQGSGKIINIASSFGVMSVPERICYCTSKAAIIYLTKALAVEWATKGIIVNCIAPGSMDIFPGSRDEKYLALNEERIKRVPLGRLGKLEELGPLVVYLTSDGSNYMTGTTVFLDGGLVAR